MGKGMLSRRIIHFVVLLGLTVTILLVASAQSASRDQDWPPFIAVYRAETPKEVSVSRLTWQSKWNWSSEVLQDSLLNDNTGSVPGLNYAGTKVEFVNGIYTVFTANGIVQSREQIPQGIFMAPGQWLVPGYEEHLKQEEHFVQVGVTKEGYRRLHKEENRRCAAGPTGSIIPNCAETQMVITEMTFGSHGIPQERIVEIDNQMVEKWSVERFELW